MDDPLLMRFLERARNLSHDLEHSFGRERTACLLEDLTQRVPSNELHGDVERAVGRGTEIVDLDGVRVLESGNGSAFAVKTGRDGRVAGQMRMERLQRDL